MQGRTAKRGQVVWKVLADMDEMDSLLFCSSSHGLHLVGSMVWMQCVLGPMSRHLHECSLIFVDTLLYGCQLLFHGVQLGL